MINNSDNLSVNDFGKVCRTCLAEDELKYLYKDDCLIEMLMSITFVQFAEKDGLPSQICLNCEKEAKRAYSFAQKCLEIDKKLKSCLTSVAQAAEINLTQQNHLKTEGEKDSEQSALKMCNTQANQLEITEPDLKTKAQIENSEQSILKVRKQIRFGPPYECKKCFASFASFKLLRQHWRESKHPRDIRTTCKICSKSVLCSRIAQHLKTHSSEQPFRCDVCGKKFKTKTNLSRHEMIHTGERPHKCHICEKAFIQTYHLKDHLRTHTGETPFNCNQCDKCFVTKGSLRLHLKVHEHRIDRIADQPSSAQFKCEICSRKFYSKSLLNHHKLIHGEKKFLCSECGRGFITKTALLSHSNLHTGLKPLTCQTCGKTFRHSSTLYNHNLLHTGDKPYVCKICNRRFTQRHHLTYHSRTHSGEKPYSCSFCNKSFALKNNLTVHMRTHTGETPYLCPVCGKGYYNSSSLKKHKSGHGKRATVNVAP